MRAVRHQRNAGFTLVEVLASLVLVAVITVTVIAALNLGRHSWETSRRQDRSGEIQASLRAMVEMLERATPAMAVNSSRVPVLVFDGKSDSLTFVTISEGESQRGGLILTEIAFRPNAPASLAIWSTPFRAASALSASHATMREADLLDGVGGLELSYFGARDVNGSLGRYSEWENASRLPLTVSVRLTIVIAGRKQTFEAIAALRQS